MIRLHIVPSLLGRLDGSQIINHAFGLLVYDHMDLRITIFLQYINMRHHFRINGINVHTRLLGKGLQEYISCIELS